MQGGLSVSKRCRWLLLAGLAAPALLSAACFDRAREGAEACPEPAPTAVVAPVALLNVHCYTCHSPSTAQVRSLSSADSQTPAPHPIEQREDCLVCHSTRSPFPFSDAHTLALNQACYVCHTPAQIQ